MSSRRETPSREEAINWIRSRPAAVHELMIRFPPSCTVRGQVPLVIPGPGKTGFVYSYLEHENGPPTVSVLIAEDCFQSIRGDCDPDWLEVVEYWEFITPDFVRAALEQAGREAPSKSTLPPPFRMLVVFAGVRDYPEEIVAREFFVDANGERAGEIIIRAPDYTACRIAILEKYPELTRIPRHLSDDPVIVEVWI